MVRLSELFSGLVCVALGFTLSQYIGASGLAMQRDCDCSRRSLGSSDDSATVTRLRESVQRLEQLLQAHERNTKKRAQEDADAREKPFVPSRGGVPPAAQLLPDATPLLSRASEGEDTGHFLGNSLAPMDIELAEAALTRHYNGRKSGGMRQEVLCYANNNQQFVDETGAVSHQWDIPTIWRHLDGDQQKEEYEKARRECVNSHPRVNFRSTVDDKFSKVAVNGKVISFDDIIMGYERIYQTFELFSSLQFLGVSMQQTPNDAFVIADLLWRVRPELVIEVRQARSLHSFFSSHAG